MGFLTSILLALFIVGCSSDGEISTAVPAGYGVASKIENVSWEQKALSALTISEANAAEETPTPLPVTRKVHKALPNPSKPSFVIALTQPPHVAKRMAKSKKLRALARRK